MPDVPFTGRLDVTLACFLVVERHGSVANRSVLREAAVSPGRAPAVSPPAART